VEPVRLFLFLAAVFFIGWNVLFLLSFKSKRPFYLLERLSIAYGLGLGFVSIEMLLFYFLKIEFSIFAIIAPWMVLFVLNSVLQIKCGVKAGTERLAETKNGAYKWLKIFLACGISFEILYAFFRAIIAPMESYDAIAIYAIKSKIFYLARSIPADFFTRIASFFPHPDYPLNIPLSETLCYLFLGSLNDQLVKVIFPFYFVGILVILYFAIKRFAGQAYALLFTFLLATIPQFNEFATNGYVDLILAYYYFISMLFLFTWFQEQDTKFLVISAVMVALAGWTKNEGLMYCGINIILLFIFSALSRKKQILYPLIYAVIIAAVLMPWLWIKASTGMFNNDIELGGAHSFNLARMFRRVMPTLYVFQKQFFGLKKWNILWPTAFVILVFNYKSAFIGNRKYLALSLLFTVSGYVFIYLTSPLDIDFFVSKTWNRFLIHMVPIVIYWLAVVLKEDIKV
jgi:hypothetical protein